MHIFFSGIGGNAIGPLALIAKQAGYDVSGSDKQDSQYIPELKAKGITNIHIGQSQEQIAEVHTRQPIDWIVYSSALPLENPDHPELVFARVNGIRATKRDEFLNQLISDKQLKLIAIAGTHGKTTTTAMVTWLLKELGLPLSYLIGTKIQFGNAGQYEEHSEYFVYECDEFDRNFLAFHPHLSLISGVSWDHHEIYPTREDYQQAFRDFISQSTRTILWKREIDYLGLSPSDAVSAPDADEADVDSVKLAGRYNRENAWIAIQGVAELTGKTTDELVEIMNRFPSLHRRMEQIIPGLYSDEAHTPEKIRGGLSVAVELAHEAGKEVVVVYEPLTNRRQHFMIDDYQDCFLGAKRVYWLPSYLAREDPDQRVIPPSELITHLSDPTIAEAREQDESLKQTIQAHLDKGDMVVAMTGGGGGSLDEWIRQEFQP